MDATTAANSAANSATNTAANAANRVRSAANGAHEEIQELREQVESLMRDRVTPMLSEAAGRAQSAARQVSDIAHTQTEAVSTKVREYPLTSVLIAAAVGYVAGRLFR